MKYLIVNLVLVLSFNVYSQTQIIPEDLKIIIGSWKGSITYLDYQSNQPFTMPANLIVEQGKDGNNLVLNNIYPNEPQANDSYKIKITKKGSLINKYKVISRVALENNQIQIQAEQTDKDDNKSALIRYTYIIGETLFVIRKEVQFNETSGWIKRSEFKYTRKG